MPTSQQLSVLWNIAEAAGELLEWAAIPLILLAIWMDFSSKAKAKDVS